MPLQDSYRPTPFSRSMQSVWGDRDRRERQALIREYEKTAKRSLVVFWGEIGPMAMVPFVDVIDDLPKDRPLDLMLSSYGGDGNTSIRMARTCRGSKRGFRIIVPDVAASAATLLTLAADSIIMSDASVLGPIDPQIFMSTRDQYVAAKQIQGTVDDLERRIQDHPKATGLYGALLVDIDGIAYQEAKDAMQETEELVSDMLRLRLKPPANPEALRKATSRIANNLQSQATHSPSIGCAEARAAGIPTKHIDTLPSGRWEMLWELHTMYVARYGPFFNDALVIEGHSASFAAPSSAPRPDQKNHPDKKNPTDHTADT